MKTEINGLIYFDKCFIIKIYGRIQYWLLQLMYHQNRNKCSSIFRNSYVTKDPLIQIVFEISYYS